MKAWQWVPVVALVAAVGACGAKTAPVRSGTTIGRAAVPAYSWQQSTGTCLLESNGVCVMYQTNTIQEDASWYVLVESCEDGDNCRRGVWQVSKATYDQAQDPHFHYTAPAKSDPITETPSGCSDSDECKELKHLIDKI